MNKINLSKIKKCNQYWEEMPENERGRLCLKCQNTIIDFRNLSDEEVLRTHLFTEGRVCGLYTKEQLQPPKRPMPKKVNRWQSLYITLFSFLTFQSFSQDKKSTTTIEQTDVKTDLDTLPKNNPPKEKEPKTLENSVCIEGKMFDESGIPLWGGTVRIKDTEIYCLTNFDGEYELDITPILDSLTTITIQYSWVGFKTEECKLDIEYLKSKGYETVDMQMIVDASELTEYVVTVRRPIYERIWYKSFYKRIWRNIKSVFMKKEKKE